jgi:hypothetical protein
MIMGSRGSHLAGLCATMCAVSMAAAAAPLHQPLPVDSTEQNGFPQVAAPHHPIVRAPPTALPGGGLHKDAEAGLRRAYSGTPIDVLTYHYDTLRTGWNQSETDLNPASVASPGFGHLKTLKVDGNVFAQPLMVSNFSMPDGTVHNVLVVATGHNSVYAFDAQNYALLWQVNLGQSQSTNDVGCGDVKPEYGISSTPVIVRAGPNAATLYVVAATEPAAFSFHTQIHALDLGTGADITPPVEIAPSATISGGGAIGFDPQNQWNRASLAYANGSIFVGIGSHCDNNAGAISGWLLRYNANLKLLHAFNTIEVSQGYELASIWMTGFAPAIDGTGHVFVVTGNGAFSRKPLPRDFGESVLKLSPNLMTVKTTFTPAAYLQLNDHDTDFGSGGVMLLPTVDGQTAPPLAVAIGKDAVLYLLDQDKLGSLRKNDTGALQAQRLGSSGNGVWGGPAYYGPPSGGLVYVQINGDVLRAFSVSTAASPALTQVAAGTSAAGYGGSLPIVSSNGAAAGTGVVWLVRRGATEQLEAYDAVSLGAPIFAANAGVWSSPGNGNSFVTAMEANGRVYVPAYKTVTVFGLTN